MLTNTHVQLVHAAQHCSDYYYFIKSWVKAQLFVCCVSQRWGPWHLAEVLFHISFNINESCSDEKGHFSGCVRLADLLTLPSSGGLHFPCVSAKLHLNCGESPTLPTSIGNSFRLYWPPVTGESQQFIQTTNFNR